MPAEKFANRPEAEVAATYTVTDTTLEVDDASAFPATGVFRVLLGNAQGTIFRVDSVAGDIFTGVAEAFDGNAAIGDTVRIVASKGAAERLIQSPDDATIFALTGPGGSVGYGPIYKSPAFDQSAWTWANQGSSAATQGGGIVLVTAPSAVGTSFRVRYKAIPTTPYTVTAGFLHNLVPAPGTLSNLAAIGLILYEVASTKGVVAMGSNFDFANGNQPPSFVVHGFSNPTTATTLYAQKKQGVDWPNGADPGLLSAPFGGLIWLRIVDDGTNVSFYYSFDRINWTLLITQTRVTGFTTAPDSLGFVLFNQTATVPLMSWIVSWEETSP